MVEIVFRDVHTYVVIFTLRQHQVGPERRREYHSYAMVVYGGAIVYREVLAKIRPVLQKSGGEDVIRSVKSTKEDKLLITLNNDRGIR